MFRVSVPSSRAKGAKSNGPQVPIRKPETLSLHRAKEEKASAMSPEA